MKILAIIVNYQTADLVIKGLHALARESSTLNDCLHVTIVDNNSRDGSFEKIHKIIEKNQWSENFKIISSKKNSGFAAGNNIALREALKTGLPDFIWLLNPDTFIRPGAARELLNFLKNNHQTAICGSRLEDEDGTPQISTFNFPSFFNEFIGMLSLGIVSRIFNAYLIHQPVRGTSHKADWLSGASVMIKREVFETIGLMDEHYFLYFEEVDFFYQARKFGFNCWYVPSSRVIHKAGAATGISSSRKNSSRRPAYWFESRRRFFIKNKGGFHTLLADSGFILGHLLWLIKTRIQKKDNTRPHRLLRDFMHYSVFLKGFDCEKQ
ncbi:MAG: glycosyltransferase family 2 protein [Deltaproteobacteria bacterium]|nr:glycosyltransferase family 2 protein [Deltaproteobacteria bacterium]